MGCLLVLLALLGPRFAIVYLWLATSRLEIAFDSGLVGLFGFIMFPWTTLIYALAYAPVSGVSAFGWFLVVLGLFADLGTLFGGSRYRR